MTQEEHKRKFFASLHSFKNERQEDLDPPSFAKKAVDQFKLWTAVLEAGGHAEVTASKGWARIGRMFDPPKTMTDLSFRIKKIYETNLLPFEKAVAEGLVEDVYKPPRLEQPASTPGSGSGTPAKGRPGRPPKRSAAAGPSSGSKRSKQEDSDEMVGKRIRVLWPDERQFFSGTVTAFNQNTGMHKIDYDDGDEEQLDLATQTWHLLTEASVEGGTMNDLELLDNGGLGQLHTAAQALANGSELKAREGDPNQAAGAEGAADDGCIIKGQGFKVYKTENPEGFEIFCLIPGLQMEEIRVQCWDSGKLLVTREPKDAQASSAWGIQPLKHKIRLPRAVHARSARALVTLHGQLYIKVFCDPEAEKADGGASGSAAAKPAAEGSAQQAAAVQLPEESAAPAAAAPEPTAAAAAVSDAQPEAAAGSEPAAAAATPEAGALPLPAENGGAAATVTIPPTDDPNPAGEVAAETAADGGAAAVSAEGQEAS